MAVPNQQQAPRIMVMMNMVLMIIKIVTCNGFACATVLSTSAAAAFATASMVIGSRGYSSAWNG
jgi:hypothetical protein